MAGKERLLKTGTRTMGALWIHKDSKEGPRKRISTEERSAPDAGLLLRASAGLEAYDSPISGCYYRELPHYDDERGRFMETFNEERSPVYFAQTNLSYSEKDVIRGLHIQRTHPQGKLIQCIKGIIWDVCVDLRPGSPTFGQWHAQLLRGEAPAQFYIPVGCAHGFASITDSIVQYSCTTPYDKASDGGVNLFDKDLKIPWPVVDPTFSQKDFELPFLSEYIDRYL